MDGNCCYPTHRLFFFRDRPHLGHTHTIVLYSMHLAGWWTSQVDLHRSLNEPFAETNKLISGTDRERERAFPVRRELHVSIVLERERNVWKSYVDEGWRVQKREKKLLFSSSVCHTNYDHGIVCVRGTVWHRNQFSPTWMSIIRASGAQH